MAWLALRLLPPSLLPGGPWANEGPREAASLRCQGVF